MVKTATPQNAVNFSDPDAAPDNATLAGMEDELFYNSIKPQLNALIKEPSEATMEQVLAYAIQK